MLISFTIVNLTYFSTKKFNLLDNLSNENDENNKIESNKIKSNKIESNKIEDDLININSNSNKKNKNSKNNGYKQIIKKPIYLTLITNKINYLPKNVIDEFDIKNSELKRDILISFLNIKYTFTKLFTKDDELIIKDLNSFIKLYKTIINTRNKPNYNICVILNNSKNNDKYYFYIKNTNIIKINDNNEYELILENLKKNNIFIMNGNNEFILSYGTYYNSSITKNEIIKLFFNNITNINDYNEIINCNKIYIIYWISSNFI